MQLSNNIVILFRLTLVVALIIVTWLTTAQFQQESLPTINDKIAHALTFTILAFFLDFSLPTRRFDSYKVLALMAFGVGIEIIQFFLPYRSFSLLDMLADAMGIVVYLLFIPAIKFVPLLKTRWDTGKVDL